MKENYLAGFMPGMDAENIITVLTVHGKDDSDPAIYFSNFNTLKDAHAHCRIVNTLTPKENEWLYARIVKYSEKYRLAKPPVKYDFEILRMLSDEDIKTIEKLIYKKFRDFYVLSRALKGASKELQERFFDDNNINQIDPETYAKREFETLDEFRSYLESIDDSDALVKEARGDILKIITELMAKGELLFPLSKIDAD
jgi:flagellar motor switch protein FliG